MNKNIKYAGVVAATLLAVAPVATSVTTVNAAATNDATTTSRSSANGFTDFITNALKKVNDFFDGLMKQTVTKPEVGTKEAKATDIVNNISDQTYSDDSTLPDFNILREANNSNLSSSKFAKLLTQLGLIDSKSKDFDTIKSTNTITYTVSGGFDNDLNALIDNMVSYGNGGSFSVLITSKDKTKDSTKDADVINHKQVTFTNNKTVTAPTTGMNVQYTTPIVIGLNTKVVDQELTNSVSATVTNNNGAKIPYTVKDVGKIFFNSETSANTNNMDDVSNPGGIFTKDGAQYYQRVTLSFDPKVIDVQKMFDGMDGSENHELSINGEPALKFQINHTDGQKDATTPNSITYVRELAVGTQPNDNDNNTDTDTDTDTDTTPDETWSMTPNSGIVTVNGSLAPLHNDDNDVTTRSLGANSAWQTDQYRVNSKTGEKQYRVSSHEWVSSDYVTFGGTTSNGSGLSNVSDLTGHHTISLAGPDGFVYALFGINGGRSNRGLAGNSAWFTDKSATDSEGNTFYRVSTDEWVQAGSGVTFN
ncbi:hypothetical protein [Companilactobacillus mishanensis]|uniref:Surface layer protein A domain-containing protein n=1 Tax=Companilactobacillus mishanensis TaxID=2486008 RepID=A0A5P0ZK24_9LACO|nr:hypothetical protein [Companilactobacillus mishanensis]MQS53414.1 hypothetical protein [Companilactobacillus mishanensis]